MRKSIPDGRLWVLMGAAVLVLGTVLAGPAEARAGREGAEGEKRFAKSGGARVHYRSFGKGDEALVFVHGWTCDWTFWRGQIPAFSKTTRVLALDLPGHGESEQPPDKSAYTMDSFARAVEAVMRDAKVGRAVLVGHSMGTPVVRQFYRLFPGKTRALVFVDGSLWQFAPREVSETFIAPMRADYPRARAAMLEGMLRPMLSDAERERVRAAMSRTPAHVAVPSMEALLDEANFREDVIKVPALAVIARSPFWPPDSEQRFRRLAPDLDFRAWDGVSHFLMIDKPDDFNRELQDFLARRKLLK
jgi:pimeloyl-ACP methyl ester carboxylesterase